MQGGGSTERDGVGKGYSGEDEAAVKLKKLWGIMGNSMSAFQMASFLQLWAWSSIPGWGTKIPQPSSVAKKKKKN